MNGSNDIIHVNTSHTRPTTHARYLCIAVSVVAVAAVAVAVAAAAAAETVVEPA